jgi:hypothetical protein
MRLMARLAETRDLDSITQESVAFRDFQAFIERQYFRRDNASGLGRVAAGAPPVTHSRLQAVHFEPEERRTETGM